MKRRNRRIALAAFGVLGALGFACTFPDVSFAPVGVPAAEGGGPGTSDGAPGVIDGGGPTDAPPSIFADAFTELEASAVKDDAGKTDASVCPDGCDCDDDTSENADAGCNAGGKVPDCDDHDKRTQPGMGLRDDPPEAPRFGDWDCDGTVEKKYPPNFDCSKVDLNSCPSALGVANDPPCGSQANVIGCKIVTSGVIITTTSCVQDATKSTTDKQLCR